MLPPPPSSSAPTTSSFPTSSSSDVLALAALRFRARQASAHFLVRSIDDALIVGAGETELIDEEYDGGRGVGISGGRAGAAVLAAPTANPRNHAWADSARDALARDARKRRREAERAGERAQAAVDARFAISSGGGSGSGGRGGRGRGGGRGLGRPRKTVAVAEFAAAPAAPAAAAPSSTAPPPQILPPRVALFPLAPFAAADQTPPPVPRGRKKARAAEEADARYRAAVAAANASAAATAVGGAAPAAGGGFLSFPSPLGSPAALPVTLAATLPAPAAAERFVHPSRWPPKGPLLRARGASRLSPVSESVTPRRLRPAPWGVLPRQGDGADREDEEEEGDGENITKVSSSVLRVAGSSSSFSTSSPFSSTSSNLTSSSCFPRTVVRRSRIAGLGLYALARISRGSAVAEYSGELVRAPLADLREADYIRLGLGVYFFSIGTVGGSSGAGVEDEFGCGGASVDASASRLRNTSSSSSSSSASPPLVIDATMKGGRARFVNHSCSPNCFAELVVGGCGGGAEGESGDEGGGRGGRGGKGGNATASFSSSSSSSSPPRPRVLIRAAVDLRPGEEITYDYCLSGEPDAAAAGGGTGGGGRSHDLNQGEVVVRCACGAPSCRGVL